MWYAINGQFVPNVGLPWHPPDTTADRVRRAATMTAGLPLMVAAFAVDLALKPFIQRGHRSNMYRLLAQAPQS
jgi:hypothetical protein